MDEKYKKNHEACPKCGNEKTSQSYLAFLSPPDLNQAWCSCGWKGVVDQLVPKKTNKENRMEIKKPFTDEEMIEAIKKHLNRVTEETSEEMDSMAMVGLLGMKQHDLIHAVQNANGDISSSVLQELIKIAVVCIIGARSYIHGGKP